MKRMIGICLILSFLIALSACSHPQSDGSGQEETAAETKESTTPLENTSFPEEKETDLEQETMETRKDKLLYMEQASIRITTAEGFIMIAPFYGSYDSVYRHTDYFADIVRDALVRYPMNDKSRITRKHRSGDIRNRMLQN